MVNVLLTILVALSLTYILGEIAKSFSLPRVVGQLSAGLILSHPVLKQSLFSQPNQIVFSFLANLGIILLFYYAGMTMNISTITSNVKRSVLISVFNTLIPFGLGFATLYYGLDFSLNASLIMGSVLAVTSQAVSLDVLDELKILRTKLANIIITTGAVDDTIELLFITALLSFIHISISHVAAAEYIRDIILFIGVLYISRALAVPAILKIFNREHSHTARFTASLIILLIIIQLAEFLKVGAHIGALFSGVIVRQTILKDTDIPNWHEQDIASSLHTMAFGFLAPLFFVWTGINTDLTTISANIPLISLLFFLATIGTITGSMLAVYLTKGTLLEGWIIGWGLNPKGDIDLIISFLALSTGIISQSTYTALVIMSILTATISPIVFKSMLSSKTIQKKAASKPPHHSHSKPLHHRVSER